MKVYFTVLLFILSLGLAGCPTPQPTPTVIDTKGLTESVAKLEELARKNEEANKKVDEIKRKSLSKASAAVKGMLRANEEVPEGNPKATIKAEGQIATDRLPEADREDLLEMTQRVMLMLQGKYEEAKGHYAATAADLTATKMSLAAAEKERDIMKLDKDAAILKAKGEVEDIRVRSKVNEDGMRIAFNQERQRDKDEIKNLGAKNASRDWSLYAKIAAGLAFSLAAYAFFRKDTESAAGAGFFTVVALGCTAMSVFVGSDYFYTIAIIAGFVTVIGGIAAIAYFFINHRREKAAEKNTEELEMGNYVYHELHEAFQKAKVVAPDAAAIIGEVFQKELSNDSKAFIDKTALDKKQALLPE